MSSDYVPELTYHRTVSALLELSGGQISKRLASAVLDFRADRILSDDVQVTAADEVCADAFEFWIRISSAETFGAFYVEYHNHPLVFFAYRANVNRLKRDDELIDWAQNALDDCISLFDQTHDFES